MSRFIKSSIWQSDEFLNASAKHKLLWFYLITNCNAIGIFSGSLKLASFQLGEVVTHEDVMSVPGDVEQLKDGRYWLPKFVQHQYGNLSENCAPHRRYMADLEKEGLLKRVLKGYSNPTLRVEDKEKDKDKEEDKEKEKECAETFSVFWDAYPRKVGRQDAEKLWSKLSPSDRQAATIGARKYASIGLEQRYTMHGDSFIRKRRWEEPFDNATNDKPVKNTKPPFHGTPPALDCPPLTEEECKPLPF